MSLYKTLFENVLDMPVTSQENDAEVFQKGFENEQDFENVQSETQSVEMTPEEIDAIVKRGQVYKEKIDKFVILLKNIQSDVLKGMYKTVQTKGLDKFAPLIGDLQDLGTALTAGVGDNIIKSRSEKK
jgi:hypothetical protein